MSKVNFIPWRQQKQKRKIRFLFFCFCSYCICMLLCIILLYICQTQDNALKQNTIEQTHLTNTNLQQTINKIKSAQQKHAFLSNTLNEIKEINQHNQDIVLLINSIAQQIPEAIWLTQVSIHQQKITLTGNAVTYPDVTQFINRMRQFSCLHYIKLTDIIRNPASKASTHSYLTFKLEALC